MNTVLTILSFLFNYVFLKFWWVWIPPVLGRVVGSMFLKYTRSDWVSKIDWVLLKIQVPKDVEHGPKNMEQVLAQIYGAITGGGNVEKQLFFGKIREWASLEIESNGGIVNFYIRIRRIFRPIVEGALYAQYPDIKVTEAEDYTKQIPPDLPDDKYTIFGTDFSLLKPDPYPIKTYIDFKDELADIRTQAKAGGIIGATGSWIDPMSGLVEALAQIPPTDKAWIHILIRPDKGWGKRVEKERDKLVERVKAKNPSVFQQFVAAARIASGNITDEVTSIYSSGKGVEFKTPEPEKPKESRLQRGDITEGEMEVVKSMERSLTKLGFKTEYRAMVIHRREHNYKGPWGLVYGAIHQFNSTYRNGFDFRRDAGTKLAGYNFLAKFRFLMRQKKLLWRFQTRQFFHLDQDNVALGVLTTEELATIFHLPASFVQTPQIGRAEARKGAPPMDLPIIE